MTIADAPPSSTDGAVRRGAARHESTRSGDGHDRAGRRTGRPPVGLAPRHGSGSRAIAVLAALACGAAVAVVGYVVEASRDAAAEPALGPGLVTVEIGIEHSRFSVTDLRVHEGSVVRFVVRNDDPIDHELVVGDDAVHARHAVGDEPRHPPVPGEVSVATGATAMTFYELTKPGTVVYACHLPGHLAYGMRGEIEVVPVS